MAIATKKSVQKPDEVRTFPNGKLEVVRVGSLVFGKAAFEPGWKWSESVKPIVGTRLCMVHHDGYIISGRLHVRMEDGKELDLEPGDAFELEPGHDAWVLGNETCVALDFAGAALYAKPARPQPEIVAAQH